MAKLPYRKADRGGWAFLFIVLFGIGLAVFGRTMLFRDARSGAEGTILIVPILLSFLIGFVLMLGKNKKRLRAIEKALSAHGWTVTMTPSMQNAVEVFGRFHFMVDWAGLASKGHVGWIAHRGDEFAYEHEWSVGIGKHSEHYERTGWISLGNTPTEATHLMIFRPLTFERGKYKENIRSTGDEEFDKDWAVLGAVEHLPTRFKESLDIGPKGEWWTFGVGCLVLTCQTVLDGPNIRKFVARGDQKLRAIDAHFDAKTP